MKLFKKAIATYIVVISISSLIITLFFLGILDSIYSKEDTLCQEINFILEDSCLVRNGLHTKVVNLGELDLEVLINGVSKQTILKDEKKLFNFDTSDENNFEFLPVISVQGKTIACNSKTQSVNSNLISRNCN